MTPQAAAAVGLYAALNVLILLWLTIATSRLRGRYKVLVGDNGVPHLIRIMRGHANAVENMPMMMVLMLVAALLGTPVLVLASARRHLHRRSRRCTPGTSSRRRAKNGSASSAIR